MFSILIAGLHKTGTTGLYNAIKSAVPQDARYLFIYEPKEPKALLAPGRYAPYRPILTKILVNRLGDCAVRYRDFDRRIMMIRDPRDVVVSRLLFRPMFGWTSYHLDIKTLEPFIAALKEKEANPTSHSVKGLHELADQLGISNAGWPQLRKQVAQKMRVIEDEEFLALRYEDFVEDRLDPISEYLELPIANPKAGDESWKGHIQRSMAYGDWKHWFLDEDVEFFGEMFADYMGRFGYDDRERATEPRIDPATSSEYIAGKTKSRIIERQQRGSGSWTPDDVRTDEELNQLISMAEDGRSSWAYRLALVYRQGVSQPPDAVQALAWARHAAIFGHVKAMKLAADLLETQETSRADLLEARFWRREHDRLTGRQRTTPAAAGDATAHAEGEMTVVAGDARSTDGVPAGSAARLAARWTRPLRSRARRILVRAKRSPR